jgi:hypothetical protein
MIRRPHLEHQLRAVRGGDDPLGQSFAHSLEYLGQSRRLVLPFGGVACPAQRGLYGVCSGGHAVLAVGEQVDVLGGPVDDAVRDEGVTAAEGEAVPGRRWRPLQAASPKPAAVSSSRQFPGRLEVC